MLEKNKVYFLFISIFVSFISLNSFAEITFDKWLEDFKREAITKGISQSTLEVLKDAKPIKKTIKLDRNQPEFKLTFEDYKKRIVSDYRINKAKKEFIKNKDLLDKISKKYNVQSRYIISLWAIESNFGNNMGNFNLFHTLASLAYDGRRSKYFRSELISALKIIENEMVDFHNIKSGWAGALGQCQFMPSSYLKYAVDENKDGIIDIWNTKEDVFGSIANYLSKNGWKGNLIWGRSVSTKKVKNILNYNMKNKKINDWSKIGIKKINGANLPLVNINAKLLIVDKMRKNSFLVYNNFETLLKWNRSNYFALSVGLLSDKIIN